MCVTNNELMRQKFGFQRAEFNSGLSEAQKSLNQFDTAVYFPTNWHHNGYVTHKGKFPAFIRYGGLVPVAPEWFQRNFAGMYSIKQQPQVNEPESYTVPRYV